MLHDIKGYADLEEYQQRLFIETFERHNATRWESDREKYAIKNIEQITWDPNKECLIVTYKNGDWWHYTTNKEWY